MLLPKTKTHDRTYYMHTRSTPILMHACMHVRMSVYTYTYNFISREGPDKELPCHGDECARHQSYQLASEWPRFNTKDPKHLFRVRGLRVEVVVWLESNSKKGSTVWGFGCSVWDI